jgi:hypothetical protein
MTETVTIFEAGTRLEKIPIQVNRHEEAEGAAFTPGGRRIKPLKPTVSKDDPRYFSPKCFPTPEPGQDWKDARYEQLAAIDARKAERRRERGSRDAAAWATVEDINNKAPLRERFASLLPPKPYYADNPKQGIRIGPRATALRHRHVQLNGPNCDTWLVFDIDRVDARFAAEDGNLPSPNFVAVNPKNGHAHIGYLLAKPVHKYSASRRKPMEWAAAIERGVRRRLGADHAYPGLLTKNPLHRAWRVTWPRDEPYLLDELAEWLFQHDMRPEPKRRTSGLGRNCDCFDKTSEWAYRKVLRFKRLGSLEGWIERCTQVAAQHNQVFRTPLGPGEVRAIGKSVAHWTWRKFTEEGFSRRQAFCGKRGIAKRWAGHVAVEKTEPWKAEGISRATWYRRHGAAGTLRWSAKQASAERRRRETLTLSDNSAGPAGDAAPPEPRWPTDPTPPRQLQATDRQRVPPHWGARTTRPHHEDGLERRT